MHEHHGWRRAVSTRPPIYNAYQRLISLDYRAIKSALQNFIGPGAVHLDLACGTGNLCPFVLEHGGRYVGIDNDPRAISYARSRFPGIDFRIGDARELPPGERFERIFAVGLLHHLDDNDVRRALSAVRGSLSRDGRYLLIDAIPPSSRWNIVGTFLRRADNGAHVRAATEYEDLVSTCFRIIRSDRTGLFPLDYIVIEAD